MARIRKICFTILAIICGVFFCGIVDFKNSLKDIHGIFGNDTIFTMKKIECLIVHHTACENAQLQDIENLHRKQWSNYGFAYHYFVTDTCTYKVHNDKAKTAHCANEFFNENSIAICVSGNFEMREPTVNELKNLLYTLIYLQIKYDISTDKIFYHGEVSKIPTACCGKKLIKFLNKYRKNDFKNILLKSKIFA